MLFLRFVFGAVAALVTIAIQLQPQLGHFNQQQLFNRRQCNDDIDPQRRFFVFSGGGIANGELVNGLLHAHSNFATKNKRDKMQFNRWPSTHVF